MSSLGRFQRRPRLPLPSSNGYVREKIALLAGASSFVLSPPSRPSLSLSLDRRRRGAAAISRKESSEDVRFLPSSLSCFLPPLLLPFLVTLSRL